MDESSRPPASGDLGDHGNSGNSVDSGDTGRQWVSRRWLLLAAAAVVLGGLIVLASGGGGTDPFGASESPGNATSPGSSEGDGIGTGDDGEFAGQHLRQVAPVTDNATAALREAGSMTLVVDSRTVQGDRTVVRNQSLAVDLDAGRYVGRVRERYSGGNDSTLATDLYSNGTGLFVRQGVEGLDAHTYQYLNHSRLSRLPETASSTGIDRQFDFDRSTTAAGDTLLTVDSVDQLAPVERGKVTAVSLRVVVDAETSLVTRVTYHLEIAGNGQDSEPVVYDLTRTITGIGETTVREPAWLAMARNRTGS